MEQYAANSMIGRMIRAAKLESQVYEDLEGDTSATTQALTVVVIVAIAGGIGSALSVLFSGAGGVGLAVTGFILGIIAAVVGWAIWSFLTYWIGTSLFGGKATYSELLRTIGFAYTPNALGIFSFIPLLGGLIALVGAIWALIAGIIAIRQALDFDTGKAVLTAVIGWIIMLVITFVVAAIGGVGAALMR